MTTCALALTWIAAAATDYPSDNGAGAFAAFAALMWLWVTIFLGALIINLVANWKIAEKAGYSGVMSLLMLIPLANVVFFLIFAFSEWPIEARLRQAGPR
jgi:hypothetical protein